VPPLHAAITIASFAFSPSSLSVPVGATVTVTNKDNVAHTWTAKSGAFDSGPLAPGASYSFTFTQPGTYDYFCRIHSFMTGSVNVTG
jgi:plastocyanin